jgi:hypothetical protein
MKIKNLLKSNEFMFFLVALVLFGFAINTLGKRKNNMYDGFANAATVDAAIPNVSASGASMPAASSASLTPSSVSTVSSTPSVGPPTNTNISNAGTVDQSDDKTDVLAPPFPPSAQMLGARMEDGQVATLSSTLPKEQQDAQPVNPEDLLPKDSNSLSVPAPMIPLQEPSLRNANMSIRSDPLIPKTDTGPWNQTTIEPDKTRTPFEIGSTSGANKDGVSGWTRPCPFWMSSDVNKEGASLLSGAVATTTDALAMAGGAGAGNQGLGANAADSFKVDYTQGKGTTMKAPVSGRPV